MSERPTAAPPPTPIESPAEPELSGISADRRAHMTRSSLIVMGAFVASKVVGLLRERAIGFQFGVTADYDAYVAAFRIPDLLFTLIAGGALVSAFLPVFAEALADDENENERAWRVASAVTNLVLIVTAVLAGVSALFAPAIAPELAPGFTAEQQALTAQLMRIILVSTLIFAISGIQMGILNAFQHFLTPALAPVVYNLGILFGALVLAPMSNPAIHGLAWGVVVGAIGHLLVKVPALVRHGFRWFPVLNPLDPDVRQVLWLMWPRVVALGTVQLVFFINTRLASQVETGSVAALNYAWVISQMPQTILGTAIATVAFPTLAELAARRQRRALRSTTVGALRLMIALSVPAAVALWALSEPVISVLLQTGRFDQAAANATALALRFFALGLVGHVTFEVVARAYYAQKDTLTPLWIGIGAMVVNIGLAYALVGPLAQGGLALANSIAITVEVIVALWILGRRWQGIEGGRLAETAMRAVGAGVAMAWAIRWSLGRLPDELMIAGSGGPFIDGLARVLVGMVVGGAVYVLVAAILRMKELGWARDRVLERFRRGRSPEDEGGA